VNTEGSEGAGGRAERARVGILLSGRGSNFLALHGAMQRGEVAAEVALVVGNVAEAVGLEKARALRLATACFPNRLYPDRVAQEVKILAALAEADVEWVCLAGYMRRLTPAFVAEYPQRILNVHPSLLPAFPGLDAQRQAWEHGVRVAGCTVHLVDEGLDSGPIVVQRTVPVRDDDGPESLAARILAEEHLAYPEALRRLISERWAVRGRRLVFSPGS
jgi:phosphoribosylglycinamide formyltransferase-1